MPFTKHEELLDNENTWSCDKRICHDPEHNPPTMIVLKPGIHTYKCPSCGASQVIKVQNITLNK